MALASAPVHCASKFSWHGTHGTAELSDLGPGRRWGRVLAVVPAPGFVLRSPRTGQNVPFFLNDVAEDCNGEVTCWTFGSSDGKFLVTVYND